MLSWFGEESISPRQNFSLGYSFSRSESHFPSQTPCLSKEGVCGSTGNQKVGEIIIRKCSILKKSVRLESLTDGWQSLPAACYKGCVVGMGDVEFLTTAHPRAALDNLDLRINQSQSLP